MPMYNNLGIPQYTSSFHIGSNTKNKPTKLKIVYMLDNQGNVMPLLVLDQL